MTASIKNLRIVDQTKDYAVFDLGTLPIEAHPPVQAHVQFWRDSNTVKVEVMGQGVRYTPSKTLIESVQITLNKHGIKLERSTAFAPMTNASFTTITGSAVYEGERVH